jgi:predicted CxxxxCH...CXXCH cytochrome family protein
MSPTRFSSLALAGLLAAAGCGTSRSTPAELAGSTTFVAGSASGQDVTVENRWCVRCHGSAGNATDPATDAAGIAFAPPADASGQSTGKRVGTHQQHLRASALRGQGVPCASCHVTPSDAVSHEQDKTKIVRFRGLARAVLHVSDTPINPAYDGTACSNVYCHGAFTGGNAATVTWDSTAALTCNDCHGRAAGAAATPPAGTHDVSNTDCGGCHGGYTATSVNPALHVNGQIDGGGEPTTASDCAGCHGAIFTAMSAGSPASRHALAVSDPALLTGINWAAPLDTNLVASRSCTNMCHDPHPHDLGGTSATHEYNVYVDANARATAPTTSTRAKTDFDAAATNGGLCVSCHRFGSTNTTAFDAAAFGASAHDFTAASGSTWQYALHAGSFDRNCTKCHASNTEGRTPTAAAVGSGTVAVHFNLDNATLLSGTTSPIGAGTVCYNCHGSAAPVNGAQGDRSGVNIQAQFAKANNHAVAGSCLACHDPHQAKAGDHATPGNLAGPPIQGADGAVLATNPAFWTAPAAGAFTAKTIVAGTDLEATLCFRCHSAFGGATDVAKEFNPANTGNFAGTWAAGETAGGFHPVLAASGSNLGAVKLTNLVTTNHAWSTTTRNTMTCTDCHGSDAIADPNGPHGSTANFILKGPNTTWSASVVLGSTIPAGTFCLNCHQSTFTNSRFTGHAIDNHAIPCFNCHAAVPHGGPRPGMLIDAVGAGNGCTPPGGVIADWDTAAPYDQSTIPQPPAISGKLCILSYPTTNAGNWAQGNCGCNGSGH